MKNEYKHIRFGNVASFSRGLTFAKSEVANKSSKMVLRSNNIDLSTHTLNFDDIAYLKEDFAIPEEKKLHKGDIFICMSNGSTQHLGKVAFIDKDMDYAFGGFMGAIHPDVKLLCPKFAFYACLSSEYRRFLASIFNGININNLKWSDLSNLLIPVPSLEEQERIVAELDLLTGIIDKQKAQLKELDTLARSIFYDMFEGKCFDVTMISDVCKSEDDIKCGPFGTQLSKDEYQSDGIAVYGIPQVNSSFSLPPKEFVNPQKAAALDKYSVFAGDIVMSRKGNVGQCAVFPSTISKGVIHSDVLRIRVNTHIANPIFLMYQLHFSQFVRRQILDVSSGAIMQGINVGKLKRIHVEVPPILLQESFVKKIQSIDQQKQSITRSIADTQKLFDYTMDKYFG